MIKSVLRWTFWSRKSYKLRPTAAQVLHSHLIARNFPCWTSYFVKYSSVQDSHFGRSHFNFQAGKENYHVLRTGCYPYIKYHCTKGPVADFKLEDKFFNILKIFNFGLPCLAYGIAAKFLITHEETVATDSGPVKLYFLLKEVT